MVTAPMPPGTEVVTVARRLADQVLFPAALAVDASDYVPAAHLDDLAGAGMYGLFGPAEAGGLAAGWGEGNAAVEALAGGCLTTAFVWAQHHHAVRAVAATPSAALRQEWLAPLCRGERRAGVAFAGLRRPGPPVLVATELAGRWRLDGYAPWVTGWGRVDVVHVGARAGDDVVWLLVDATPSATLAVERLDLAAVNASATVTVTFHGHEVSGDRLTGSEPYVEWSRRDALGLRVNGSHPLGVADRCRRLLDAAGVASGSLADDVDAARDSLDAAGHDTMATARARASLLAVRAASALVAAGGGRSVTLDHHAQRLAREAMFLLVFGQTPAIKAAQLAAVLDG
ncbi:MAG TPA: acyl-CoA dehydrogenase family protein [Acidimicrobiales bacterium]|jgi:alkylation response protein AidB-like acyl-CoA dehydrogenase|nr:acyl-CoA dehydrogenase family protein [Acidimicrobiales bacterium]